MSFHLEVLTNHQIEKTGMAGCTCTCGARVSAAEGDSPVERRWMRAFAKHQAYEITKALRNMTGGDLEWTYEHTETSSSGVTINAAVSVPMTADVGVRASVAGQSVHDAVQLISDRIWSDE